MLEVSQLPQFPNLGSWGSQVAFELSLPPIDFTQSPPFPSEVWKAGHHPPSSSCGAASVLLPVVEGPT